MELFSIHDTYSILHAVDHYNTLIVKVNTQKSLCLLGSIRSF